MREWLNSSKVTHHVGADKDEYHMKCLLNYLQDQNIFRVQLISAQGYNSDLLAEKLSGKVDSAIAKLTFPYSKECIKALKIVKTHRG